MKLIVGTPTTYDDLDSKATKLDVPFQIVDDAGTVLADRRQSFPLGTSEDEIKEFLSRALAVHQDDTTRYEASQEHQAALESSSAVASKLQGITITN
jgi:hypothetical protein